MVQKHHGIHELGSLRIAGHIPRSLEEEATDHLQVLGVEIGMMEYGFPDSPYSLLEHVGTIPWRVMTMLLGNQSIFLDGLTRGSSS